MGPDCLDLNPISDLLTVRSKTLGKLLRRYSDSQNSVWQRVSVINKC